MSVAALRRGRLAGATDDEEISRLMECTQCQTLCRVYEAPKRFLDERDYVCGRCATGHPKEEAA